MKKTSKKNKIIQDYIALSVSGGSGTFQLPPPRSTSQPEVPPIEDKGSQKATGG